MTFNGFKEFVKKRKSRNFKFVRIRANRLCEHCGKKLSIGTECLTINPKFKERIWVCDDCIERRLNLANARAFKASIAFDDEGGYMAAQEWEDEAISEFYEYEDEDYYPHEDD